MHKNSSVILSYVVELDIIAVVICINPVKKEDRIKRKWLCVYFFIHASLWQNVMDYLETIASIAMYGELSGQRRGQTHYTDKW